MPRFFIAEKISAHSELRLPTEVAHHAVRVLRCKEGEAITLFDGTGGEYEATLRLDGRSAFASVGDFYNISRESVLDITLVQALQSNDKMEITLQKAVELGVSRISPVAAARSVLKLTPERALRKIAHWQSILTSACEQCGRNSVPQLLPVLSLTNYLTCYAPAQKKEGEIALSFLPHARNTLSQTIKVTQKTSKKWILLIGPEGGFSDEEIHLLEASAFLRTSLGPRILRTETASIAAISALHALIGDF